MLLHMLDQRVCPKANLVMTYSWPIKSNAWEQSLMGDHDLDNFGFWAKSCQRLQVYFILWIEASIKSYTWQINMLKDTQRRFMLRLEASIPFYTHAKSGYIFLNFTLHRNLLLNGDGAVQYSPLVAIQKSNCVAMILPSSQH